MNDLTTTSIDTHMYGYNLSRSLIVMQAGERPYVRVHGWEMARALLVDVEAVFFDYELHKEGAWYWLFLKPDAFAVLIEGGLPSLRPWNEETHDAIPEA